MNKTDNTTILHDPWYHICQYLSYRDTATLSAANHILQRIAQTRLEDLKKSYIKSSHLSLKDFLFSIPEPFVESTIYISFRFYICFEQKKVVDVGTSIKRLKTLPVCKRFNLYAKIKTFDNKFMREITRFFKQHHVEKDEEDKTLNPMALKKAVQCGEPETVRYLLELGADPNKDHLLFNAIRNGDKRTASLLIYFGADMDRQCKIKDGPCIYETTNSLIHHSVACTPLSFAIWNDKFDMVKLLLSFDADPKIASDTDGNTPLHYAVQKSHVQMVKLLLLTNVSINQENAYGRTPLDLTRFMWLPSGWEITNLLRQKGGERHHYI